MAIKETEVIEIIHNQISNWLNRVFPKLKQSPESGGGVAEITFTINRWDGEGTTTEPYYDISKNESLSEQVD